MDQKFREMKENLDQISTSLNICNDKVDDLIELRSHEVIPSDVQFTPVGKDISKPTLPGKFGSKDIMSSSAVGKIKK
jgi:hypothetical protein